MDEDNKTLVLFQHEHIPAIEAGPTAFAKSLCSILRDGGGGRVARVHQAMSAVHRSDTRLYVVSGGSLMELSDALKEPRLKKVVLETLRAAGIRAF